MTGLIERYARGECREVWHELSECDAWERLPGAVAVVEETMRRVRANLEVIVGRLRALDYEFGCYPSGQPVPAYSVPLGAPASPKALEACINRIESAAGTIPVTLKAFWRGVGTVDLVGFKADWCEYLDPLVVHGPNAAIPDLEDWLADAESERGAFLLPIAPDVLHKDDVSGGLPYGFELPCSSVDGPLAHEWHETTFVDYLRCSILECGGFPGASAENPEARHRSPISGASRSHLESLRQGLVRF